ncbi:folylpolyglutamate synthase [Puccinia graminis f. sp. tritici]|uniref:Folylpolyglutamate synthase n=1 Tax=Puccinia graminis f. sp. tritici TaxID=56615 RepID=A0A5B0Q0T2_PUCGR|nr:folylpolyglutamate synthase [Puccinia graminis f. sp. tritici]
MAIKLGLERIGRLLECLANPQLRIPIIHVAGTNGKGSVCAYEAEILRSSGYRVGRFTSPFLLDPTDSINLDGHNIDRKTFEDTKSKIQRIIDRNRIDQPTSFELLTAIAFEIFARPQSELDLALIEVGLGGQKDSTNLCRSENTLLSCITPISVDHQAFLGSTISEIAVQKAGIAKPNVPILLAQQSFEEVREIVRNKGSAESCDVFSVRPYPLPKPPSQQPLPPLPLTPVEEYLASSDYTRRDTSTHSSPTIANLLSPDAGFQHQNAATAATLAQLLRTHHHPLKLLPSLSEKVTDRAILEGLQKTRWRGRLELVEYQGSQLLLDGAHNRASAQVLGDHISTLHRPITLVMAISSPRDPADLIEALGLDRSAWPVQLVSTTFSTPEDMDWVHPVPPDLIANHFQSRLTLHSPPTHAAIKAVHSPIEALQLAVSMARNKDELVVVCGSLYLVADVLRIVNRAEQPQSNFS